MPLLTQFKTERDAARPPHMAVSLWFTGVLSLLLEAMPQFSEAQPRTGKKSLRKGRAFPLCARAEPTRSIIQSDFFSRVLWVGQSVV